MTQVQGRTNNHIARRQNKARHKKTRAEEEKNQISQDQLSENTSQRMKIEWAKNRRLRSRPPAILRGFKIIFNVWVHLG